MNKEDANVKLGGSIALLKAQASQTFEFCAREASQIFGGLAYRIMQKREKSRFESNKIYTRRSRRKGGEIVQRS